MLSPIDAISLIYKVAQTIYQQVELAKANRAQCQRLADRIRIIIQAVKDLENISDKTQYAEGLTALHTGLTECLAFIQKFSHKKSWFKEVARAGSHKEQFQALNESLAQNLEQLNLGLVAKQVINREQDKKDQQQDIQALKENQQTILQLNQEALEELQQLKTNQKEHHTVMVKQMESLKDHLEQMFSLNPKTKPLINPQDKIDFYDLRFEEFLGQGSFGEVYQGYWLEQLVAIKMITGVSALTPKQLDEFVREVNIQRRLKSPHITQFYAACLEPNRACLVMEYMTQGCLREVLDKKTLTLPEQRQLALDIARGLYYLHRKGILHRDLKSGNVLINRAGEAKLSDFGLAKFPTLSIKSANELQQSQAYEWLAPELFKREPYTQKSDIYSFGVILWEIVTGQKPFSTLSNNNAGSLSEEAIIACVLKGQRDPIPNDVPTEFKELIEACWALDPNQRPDTQTLIQRLAQLQFRPPSPSPEAEYEQGSQEEKASRYEQAYYHFNRAYEKGFFKAATKLGFFFVENNKGVKQNKPKAYEYFLEAATKGQDGAAMYNLGRMLEKGDGVTKDLAKALEWYEKAYEQGIAQAKAKVDMLKQLLNSGQYLKDSKPAPFNQRYQH